MLRPFHLLKKGVVDLFDQHKVKRCLSAIAVTLQTVIRCNLALCFSICIIIILFTLFSNSWPIILLSYYTIVLLLVVVLVVL